VPSALDADIEAVLVTADEIAQKTTELAKTIDADYADREPLLVGVLKGAAMFMSDLALALERPSTMEFMAVSSYGSSTTTSGVVRILKDLDRDIAGEHVLIVEDIIDSGLTLSWLLRNLQSRNPASIEVVALLRKRDAAKVHVPVKYVGFDIPNEFVVGYGLDYAERYRNLAYSGRLKPSVYGGCENGESGAVRPGRTAPDARNVGGSASVRLKTSERGCHPQPLSAWARVATP
jgi:hypoxanthine phosphoribosyltransferase